jgi:hypothetical protein
MKWNWGTGILTVIIIFLAACAAFIIYSRSQKWSMVEDDYYSKELRHEEKLVRMRNANALSAQLQVTVRKSDLCLQFPADFKGKALRGSINIYRPSDEFLDVIIALAADTSLSQLIPLHKLSMGRYIMKVEWSSEGKDYYQEHDLYIP